MTMVVNKYRICALSRLIHRVLTGNAIHAPSGCVNLYDIW